jgi:hypothetical protein
MIGRIAVASILAVTLIATVLALTVRNYRTAIAAHEVAADSITERSNSHAAETYLAREREAMNEYLLNPRETVRMEVGAHAAGFRNRLSRVGVGAPLETWFVRRAIAANEEFVALFEAKAGASVGTVPALRRLELELDAGEGDVLLPLRNLRAANAVYAERIKKSSSGAGGRSCLRSSRARWLSQEDVPSRSTQPGS